jgi:hypothetical protein
VTDVEPATEPAAAVSPPPAPGSRWPRVVALVALLAVAVAAGAMAVARSGEAGDLRDERDDRREVARVAAAFGAAYLSYDFDDVEASSAAVTELATEAFAESFADTSAPGIEELFATLQTSTVATTDEVFVGDVGDGRARALVVVDVAASSTASSQELSDLSFVLDLVEVDGEWRVDAVAPAPQADIGDPAGSEPTSPTTAPTTAPAEDPASTTTAVAP